MPEIVINDNDARRQTTPGANVTVIDYDFPIFDDDHLVVLRTYSNGTTATLVKTTDYSVAGVGEEDGGNITLVSASAANETFTLYRAVPLERLSDYSQAGDFRAETLNRDLDLIWMAMQELDTATERSLVLAPEDTVSVLTMPLVSTLVNKALAILANGTITGIELSSGNVAEPNISAFGASLINAANATAAATTLELSKDTAGGTQAYNTSIAQGLHGIFIDASAFVPKVTAGCGSLTTVESTTNDINLRGLPFDAASVEGAQVKWKVPASVNVSQPITARISETHPTAAANQAVVWQVKALALSSGDTIDTAPSTAVNVTVTGANGTINLSNLTGNITPSNTFATGDTLVLEVTRLANDAADSYPNDSLFLGLELLVGINARVDS